MCYFAVSELLAFAQLIFASWHRFHGKDIYSYSTVIFFLFHLCHGCTTSLCRLLLIRTCWKTFSPREEQKTCQFSHFWYFLLNPLKKKVLVVLSTYLHWRVENLYMGVSIVREDPAVTNSQLQASEIIGDLLQVIFLPPKKPKGPSLASSDVLKYRNTWVGGTGTALLAKIQVDMQSQDIELCFLYLANPTRSEHITQSKDLLIYITLNSRESYLFLLYLWKVSRIF